MQQRILSGWWRRVGAFMIDGLVLFLLYLVVAGPLFLALLEKNKNATLWSFAPESLGIVSLILAFTILYTCLLPVRTNGQTWGKMALRIRVVKLDGSPVDFLTMFLRYPVMQLGPLMAGNYFAPLFFPSAVYALFDYLFPLWDARNQCIHDKVARTVVCYEGEHPRPDAKRIDIPSAYLPPPSGAPVDLPAPDSEPPTAPPLAFYPPALGPDPAWYPDPLTPGMQRLWDGRGWTDTYRGFFDDPDGSGRLRYFDGRRWTERYL